MEKDAFIKSGMKFNRWTAIEEVKNTNKKRSGRTWLFKCDCGTEKVQFVYDVKFGRTKSCGCLQRDIAKTMHNNQTHGESQTRLYGIWKGIHSRCNGAHHSSKHYFGRGISVCNQWNNYMNFRNWALENGYRDDLTIDRIDVNGNYEPSNCRWVTLKEQANNRTNNHLLTVNGETHTISEWAEIKNIPRTTIQSRLRRHVPIEKIFKEGVIR